MKPLHTDELRRMWNSNPQLPVINVLEPSKYEQVHIAGTDNVPVSSDAFEQRIEEKTGDKTSPVVVYCASTDCPVSAQAAKKLEQAGFTNVYDYEGGTESWKEAGLPTETGN